MRGDCPPRRADPAGRRRDDRVDARPPLVAVGVAAVAVLYCAVRHAFSDPFHGAAAGLLAGAALAATPAAVLMFRFNNPDALLVLLLTVGAYCLMRATLTASWRWLLVGVVMG